MSDRPCNLEMHMRRWRESASGPMSERPRLVRREDGHVEWWQGDRRRGVYGALPSPADCAAFGGACEC